jgi:serine protease AprX
MAGKLQAEPFVIHTRRVCLLVLTALLTLGVSSATAQDSFSASKVDRSIREALLTGATSQQVIITTVPGHRGDIKASLQGHGDIVTGETEGDDLTAVIHSGDVDELAKHPWVQSVSADAPVAAFRSNRYYNRFRIPASQTHVQPAPSAGTGASANILRQTLGLSAAAAPGSVNGDGVVVAIIDSGISPNADVPLSRIAGFYDFTRLANGRPTQPRPYDDFGHGTHIAGLLGSSGVLSNYQYQGVAPAVKFVALKVLDGQGQGSTSTVIKAIDFVIAHNDTLHARVINLSLGHPIYAPAKYDPLVQAVERASAAGIVVVVAAGNNGLDQNGDGESGYTGINSPANAPSSIAVGAVDTKNSVTRNGDVVAAFSSRGPTWFDGLAKPDLVAPGVHLISDTDTSSYLYASLANNRQTVNGHEMLDLSGTSMAAPITAGVIALVLDANRGLTPNAVKAILEYTAIRLPDADLLTQGAGEINAAGAVALAGAIDTRTRLNSWWLESGVSESTTIGGTAYPWSEIIIWDNKVFGGDFIYYKNIIWGSNIVWGTRVKVRGSNIIWGSNIVWGTHVVVRARNIVWGTAHNIIWGSRIVWSDRIVGIRAGVRNIVWGTGEDNIVWGTMNEDNIVWGTYDDEDNIIWGTWSDDNIVWGTTRAGSIVHGMSSDNDNIVWGTADEIDNIVWGTGDDNIVWGTGDDNIVWGTSDDNIVWGTFIRLRGAR